MLVQSTPDLKPGLVVVDDPDRGAIQRLVLGSDHDGETLWVDVGGMSDTYAMTAGGASRRVRLVCEG